MSPFIGPALSPHVELGVLTFGGWRASAAYRGNWASCTVQLANDNLINQLSKLCVSINCAREGAYNVNAVHCIHVD